MRRQFFRLLFSIVLIICCVLGFQVLFLFAFNFNLSASWSDEVLNEFASSIEDSINNFRNNDSGSSSVVNIMVQNSSERIAGLIVRNEEGKFAISLGVTSRGTPVPQLGVASTPSTYSKIYPATFATASRFKASGESNEESVTYKIAAPRYELAMTTVGEGANQIVTNLEFKTIDYDMGEQEVIYPSTIKRKDIAGTVLVTMNGAPAAYIDVIAYNMDYYNPTKFVLFELFRAFLISIPIAIIISILMAYFVSRRNERVVRQIQGALDQLSTGDYNVKLPKTKIEEYEDITHSIYKLAKDLKRHRESRKEWIKNISHDLNTPVTSMNLLINGAEDGLFPINKALIDSIKSENDTLKDRIASVSYYSYLLSPDAKCQKGEVELINTADEVLQSGDLKCKVEFSPEFKVKADPALLSRALLEVVKNANIYSDEGTMPLWKAEHHDGKSFIIIENVGKLPNPLPQFFEPWARGDASRTAGGSGLGLPIVYQIMELHGGNVSIAEKDNLVTVTLEFPDF